MGMENFFNQKGRENEEAQGRAEESRLEKIKAKAKKVLVVGAVASLLGVSDKTFANPEKGDYKKLDNTESKIKLAEDVQTFNNSSNTASFSSGLSDTSIANLEIYDKSQTLEGGITPTGLSNSFMENPYGIKPADILTIAEKYNFPITSERDFQTALVEYLNENQPEIIEKTLDQYSTTAYGKELSEKTGLSEKELGREVLKDGLLGVRTAFMMSELLKQAPPEKPVENPPSIEQSQPSGSYIINIRGDANDGQGGYYFFDNKEDFDKVVKTIDRPADALEYKGDNAGQATYDMNLNVFNRYHSEAAGLDDLGMAWERDPQNPKLFRPKKSVNKIDPISRLGY